MTEPTLSFLNPHELRNAEENPRAISPERLSALVHALRQSPEMMLARPLIVDAKQGDVVAGNQRLKAILEDEEADPTGPLQMWLKAEGGVPCYLKEFTSPAERREWMLRDNQGYGDWIPEELGALVKQHEQDGADMSLLGFTVSEMTDLKKLADHEVVPEPDAPDSDIPDAYGVVIECDSEEQQAELLEELSERGLTVRALL